MGNLTLWGSSETTPYTVVIVAGSQFQGRRVRLDGETVAFHTTGTPGNVAADYRRVFTTGRHELEVDDAHGQFGKAEGGIDVQPYDRNHPNKRGGVVSDASVSPCWED